MVNYDRHRDFWRRFSKNKAGIIGLVIVVCFIVLAIIAPYITPYDPIEMDLNNALAPPGFKNLLGTDELGRDVFSRILVGTRTSLTIALCSVLGSFIIGSGVGMVSGYCGGIADSIIMRMIDIMLAIPDLLLAILVISILGVGIENVIVAISIAGIPGFARLARASTLAIKEQEFVEAARAIGARDFRILLRHILPNILPTISVQGAIRTAYAILNASGLSFLGLARNHRARSGGHA